MNSISIAIGTTMLALGLIFIWLLTLSLRKKRLDIERKKQVSAYQRTLQQVTIQEQHERVFKAESGHIPSMLYLAKEAERKDLQQALYWYNKAAKLDNVSAMYGVIRISRYRKHDLVLKGQVEYWQHAIASSEGDMQARYQMGLLLVSGHGTEQNIPRGYALIEEAANEGVTAAITTMAQWCQSHDNPLANEKDAALWYAQGAALNDPLAMSQLGRCYLSGKGVTPHRIKGCYWLERAAETGDSEAMYYLGIAWQEISEQGLFIAYIWLFLAVQLGHEKAKNLRDHVGSILGIDNVVNLQSLAKPIFIRMSQQVVVKHSLIKALNKLYKRAEYFAPEGEALLHHVDQDLQTHKASFNESQEACAAKVNYAMSHHVVSENSPNKADVADNQSVQPELVSQSESFAHHDYSQQANQFEFKQSAVKREKVTSNE